MSSKPRATLSLKLLPLLLACCAATGARAERYDYLSQADFLAGAFSTARPQAGKLEIPPPLAAQLAAVLGHRYREIRVRYWRAGGRSAWLLDETGKEKPITVGIVVDNARLVSVAVLVYREGHGMEVAEPEFTRQFTGAGLDNADNLDRAIDNITGATLSARALTRVARAALVLDRWIQQQGNTQ